MPVTKIDIFKSDKIGLGSFAFNVTHKKFFSVKFPAGTIINKVTYHILCERFKTYYPPFWTDETPACKCSAVNFAEIKVRGFRLLKKNVCVGHIQSEEDVAKVTLVDGTPQAIEVRLSRTNLSAVYDTLYYSTWVEIDASEPEESWTVREPPEETTETTPQTEMMGMFGEMMQFMMTFMMISMLMSIMTAMMSSPRE